MNTLLKMAPLAGVLLISACAQSNQVATRADTSQLTFAQSDDVDIHAQTAALNASADRLVMASTMKGAALGAVVGCGLTAISGAGAEKCLGGAAAGALGGGVIGNLRGKRSVERRVKLADPNKLVKSLRSTNDQMADVAINLPDHLAAQDVELHELKRALATKSITQAQYSARVDVIRQDRARLAEALTLTANQAHKANSNLQVAASKGQTGLDWHLLATSDIEKNATSARSSINLL